MNAAPRTMRVFLSSTFRDMHDERDLLARTVFPRIRKLCESRHIRWREIDLRWGITKEQAEESGVVDLCLEEIERCRPYFICMLGERYGWVPDEIGGDTRRRWPWLEGNQGASVTELEIRHGVLNDPEMRGRAFFYLRDPAYLQRLPAGADRRNFEAESPESAARLRGLKAQIQAEAPHVRGYADPGELAELVYAQLVQLIDAEYPEDGQQSPLDREQAEQDARIAALAEAYVDSGNDSAMLDAYLRDGGPPIMVTGAVGSGKSALLAKWAADVRAREPRGLARLLRSAAVEGPPKWVFAHLVGASEESGDWKSISARLVRFLRPDQAPELLKEGAQVDWVREVRKAIAAVPTNQLVVIVLDGLDQLDDTERARGLFWLPSELPANIRLVVSASGGEALEEMKRRGARMMPMRPFDPAAVRALAATYLDQYGKVLPPGPLDRIAAAPACFNPMHLLVLLEELRLHGEHETVEQAVAANLAAPDTEALYERVLARCAADFDEHRPGLVGDALGLLRLSAFGLSESELLDLLGERGRPLPQALWSPLLLALERSIAAPSGLLRLGHAPLEAAVDRHLLADPARAAQLRRRIADAFHDRRGEARHVREAAAQLRAIEDWDRLAGLLQDPAAIEAFRFADFPGFTAHVVALCAGTGRTSADLFCAILQQPHDHPPAVLAALSNLLLNEGDGIEAARLIEILVERYRRLGNLDGVSEFMFILSTIYGMMGQRRRSLDLLEEVERMLRSAGREDALAPVLLNRAVTVGEDDRALMFSLYEQAEELARRHDDPGTLSTCAGNRGEYLLREGRADEALGLFHVQADGCRRDKNDVQLVTALDRISRAQAELGRADEALAAAEESAVLAERLGAEDHAFNARATKVRIYQEHGAAEELLAECQRVAAMARRMGVCGPRLGQALADVGSAASGLERWELARDSWLDAAQEFTLAGEYQGSNLLLDLSQHAGAQLRARDGDLSAAVELGEAYFTGRFGTQDFAEARRWLEHAATRGQVDAMVNLATIYLNGVDGVPKDVDHALALLRVAADFGVPTAMNNIGAIHERGLLGAADDAQAERWYEAAAEAGHKGAMNALGWLYSKPEAARPDLPRAVAWFEKAVAAGEARAMFNLGRMYEEGRGVPRDEAQALSLIVAAGERDLPQAVLELAGRYRFGHDDYEAFYWNLKGAQLGDRMCQEEVSIMYRQGRGTPRDEEQARFWGMQALTVSGRW